MKAEVLTDLPFADYLAIDAASRSSLEYFERSPAHFFAAELDPDRPERVETPALRLGSAVHCAVLEPIRFGRDYLPKPVPSDYPGCLVTVDDYKAWLRDRELKLTGAKSDLRKRIAEHAASGDVTFFDDVLAVSPGRTMLDRDEYNACVRIAVKVRGKPAVKEILGGSGRAELTLVWTDQDTGVPCKARIDWLSGDGKIIWDLKTTEDASHTAFARSIATYNYHRQVAWYLAAVEAVLGARPDLFIFGAVEKKPPFEAANYRASRGMIEQGTREVRALLEKYADARITKHWPGYADEVREIDLPRWKVATTEETTA